MCAVSRELTSSVLRAYADLSTSTSESSAPVVAPFSELEVFSAVGGHSGEAGLLGPSSNLELSGLVATSVVGDPPRSEGLPLRSNPVTERLAKLDALHAEEVLLRHSWVLIVGTTEIDGVQRRLLQPLLSRPVRLRARSLLRRVAGASSAFELSYLGDAEMSRWIDDADRRADLLGGARFGGGSLGPTTTEELIERMPKLTRWIRASASAAGWELTRVLGPSEHPEDWIGRRGLVAIPVHSLHTVRQVSVTSLRTTLLNWSRRPGIEQTAFAAVLDPGTATSSSRRSSSSPTSGDPSQRSDPIESTMLLSASQRDVVRRARSAPVTVVSGAPGSGKTHALCAVALDTVARGGSVLVATQSRHAAEVVSELLDRTPGPTPVRFGDGSGMAGLIDELTQRSTHPIDAAEVQLATSDLELARAEVESLEQSIRGDLALESAAQRAPRWQPALPALLRCAPGVFDPGSDLDALEQLMQSARPIDGDRWLAQWRRTRAATRLRRAVGADADTDLSRLDAALQAARAGRAAATLSTHGGTDIGERWERLALARERHRAALGRRRRLAPFEAGSLDDRARAALGELLGALRAGRGRRRELLARMDVGHLSAAAPLWVGTLGDIEDVLPATPAMFDLVILDEASQIEQSRAAPALLRGRRAVVVGDPHQLRHVSFRSDDEIDTTLRGHRLTEHRGRLDVRRSSTFDLAASGAAIDHLREHFRSVPHLIEYSVRTFYRDRVEVMTRHPRNEQLDAIDVLTVAPPASAQRVHRNEVDAVVSLAQQLGEQGRTGIGVITPFRDQADAIEQAMLDRFDANQLVEWDLRVGTVHSFQGGERDTVIVSLGVAPTDPPGRRRFAEQADLFNVMVTRARERLIVVTSLTPSGTGRIDDYLRYSEQPLDPPEPTDSRALEPSVVEWRDALAAELSRSHRVRIDYPVGPWALELCVGEGDEARLIDCGVHPDGVEAHIERRLTLMGLGWRVEDGFASRWEHNAARAALELG